MKKSFEDCITFIEESLECKLLDYQKDVLRHIYNGDNFYWYPGRAIGLTQLRRAAKILYEEMLKENRDGL